jgi:hypothetical protein
MGFDEYQRIECQRAIYLIDKNIQKTECSFFHLNQLLPIHTHHFKQIENTDNIDLHENIRPTNESIHIQFDSKINDHP